MAISIAYRPVGPTYALSVTASAHAAVAIVRPARDAPVLCSFFNASTTVDVCIAFQPLSQTGAAQTFSPALVFPVDGTPTTWISMVLPANMTQEMIISVPNGNSGFSLTAIGSAAGPSIIYVTHVSPLS